MPKSCKPGYYWCYTDKKCKKIPVGWHVGRGGVIEKDDEETKKKDENGESSEGNSNGGDSDGGGVSEGTLHKWFKGSKSKDGKGGWVNVVTGGTCASDEPGEGTPKCVSSSKRASMSKKERLSAARRKKAADPGQQQKSGASKPTYVSTDKPKKKVKEDLELTDAYGETFAVIQDVIETKPMESKAPPIESYETYDLEAMTEAKDKKGKGSGSKDACYHKVKSRYSVWPSAYASGALVKCRKVGAANWGNKTKKEEFSDWRTEFSESGKKCWKGYKKVGTQKLFGKSYNRCVKEDQDIKESVRIPAKTGNLMHVMTTWRGKNYSIKMFFPQAKRPTRSEVQVEIEKVYPGSKVRWMEVVPLKPGEQFLQVSEGAAWTKKAGKSESGGLNEKGRKSYERENPGSDLKAPSKKVGNKRRASFCARMKGMRKRQKPSNNTGDDRLSKSLRAWNC